MYVNETAILTSDVNISSPTSCYITVGLAELLNILLRGQGRAGLLQLIVRTVKSTFSLKADVPPLIASSSLYPPREKLFSSFCSCRVLEINAVNFTPCEAELN